MNPWPDGPGVVEFPDGRRVRGRGLRRPLPPGPQPDFGVYLLARDPGPFEWDHKWVRWGDLRTPKATDDALDALAEAHRRSQSERVEIACGGGVGRTGTGLAVIAVFAGIPRDDAVAWVRARYNKRAVETPWQRRWVRTTLLCAMATALLLAHGCGDSGDGNGASVTLPPLTSTATTAATGTASPTTTATTTTRSVPATTVPATTARRATDATAQAFFEAWVANDATKMAANGEAAAVAQANALASSRTRPWAFDRCEGAAGSVYCSWIDAGQRLVIRVRNVEPPPRAVIEVRVEAV